MTQQTERPLPQKRSLSTRTLCGPFDSEFRKKFVGRETFYLQAEKRKILREPAVVAASLSKWNSAQNLLPRIREIEKIARGTKKRRSKAKGYVDGVSDLELYIAKKLMNKQGTKEILARMEQTAQAHFHTRKAVTDNYMRMTAAAPLFPEQDSARKVLSERQLIEKFDRFIVKKHDQEAPTMGAILGDDRDSEADLAAQIMEDKQTLTAIVRRMIAERNNFTDEDSEEPNTKTARDEDDDARRPREVRNIDWVIKQCHEFQRRFSPAKTTAFKIRQRNSLPKTSIHNK